MDQHHKERGITMRVIVTNNEKVETKYSGKVEVIMVNNGSTLGVLEEGLKLAGRGARLLTDPSRYKGYYKSLPFYVEEGEITPDKDSIAHLTRCIDLCSASGDAAAFSKEPLFAGILQKKDLDILNKVLG